MNIVMVSGHACIRVQKMALPLLEQGHDVHLIAQKIPSFWESYKTVTVYSDAGQLIEAIKIYDEIADVYHCHNEPSWFVTLLKERTDRPVILDVHDTFLTRLTDEQEGNLINAGHIPVRVTSEERTNFQLADGLVFVSDRVKDITCKEFKLEQPNIVLPSYLPEFLYKYNFGRWMGGLVYEGKVMLPEEIAGNSRSYGFSYCDYTQVAKDCSKIGMDFHLYAARKDAAFNQHFHNNFVHEPKPYRELLSCISRHDWGLVGNLEKSSQWQETLSNKMFEYIASGVPVVAINAAASSEFIEQYDIGITVKSIEELGERWGEHREKRETLITLRNLFTMNNNIDSLVEFYRGFI